jgi:hypothetical protein
MICHQSMIPHGPGRYGELVIPVAEFDAETAAALVVEAMLPLASAERAEQAKAYAYLKKS